MEAVVWSDYLCPWCYLGLARSALLESMGVVVTPRPFELHPEIPEDGWQLTDNRGRRLYDRLATECEQAGLAFRRPEIVPNTRRALETTEWVRANAPDRLAAVHRSFFDAVFVRGDPISDPEVVNDIVAGAGADAEAARAAVERGELKQAVDRSREEAIDAGAAGAPAWLIEGRALITGVQAPDFFERVVRRLQEKEETA